jgi:hypothetical protein
VDVVTRLDRDADVDTLVKAYAVSPQQAVRWRGSRAAPRAPVLLAR